MRSLRISNGDLSAATWLVQAHLVQGDTYTESWLQTLLFEKPDLIPLDAIDPGAGRIIPICRELPLPKGGTTVYLDILGVTGSGRLALIECKLWRNPQARREVIGQILEYAALLQRWSYADLTARLKVLLGWAGPNPLYEHCRRAGLSLDESRFVDTVATSLRRGDFDLIVAGDGIRSDLQAIASYLDARSGLTSRLALVEFQVWTDPAGDTIVIPTIPLRTEVIMQRIIVAEDGVPIRVETAGEAAPDTIGAQIDPEAQTRRVANRAFWQRFIDTLRLDHPDQPSPRHGGNNWVKLLLPPPASWLTVYRTEKGNSLGMSFRLTGPNGDAAFERLLAEREVLASETHLDIRFEPRAGNTPPGIGVVRELDTSALQAEDAQLEWLRSAANAMVNCFRPRLTEFARDVGLRPGDERPAM